MYIPAAFAETDQSTLHRFMREHSFATLVSGAGPGLFASHLPLLLDAERGCRGTLTGHLARENPHWSIAADQSVLVLFHGPQAYVSPAWYEAENVVPTWNYVAVHASGTLRLIEDPVRLQSLIRQTVETYEAGLATPWDLDSQRPDFILRLLKLVVGFEIEIETLEGKWKLGQNHHAARRLKVAARLREEGRAGAVRVADLMEESCADADTRGAGSAACDIPDHRPGIVERRGEHPP